MVRGSVLDIYFCLASWLGEINSEFLKDGWLAIDSPQLDAPAFGHPSATARQTGFDNSCSGPPKSEWAKKFRADLVVNTQRGLVFSFHTSYGPNLQHPTSAVPRPSVPSSAMRMARPPRTPSRPFENALTMLAMSTDELATAAFADKYHAEMAASQRGNGGAGDPPPSVVE